MSPTEPPNDELQRSRRSYLDEGRVRRSLTDECKEVGNICDCQCAFAVENGRWSISLSQSPPSLNGNDVANYDDAGNDVANYDDAGNMDDASTTSSPSTTSTVSSKWATNSAFTSISKQPGKLLNLKI